MSFDVFDAQSGIAAVVARTSSGGTSPILPNMTKVRDMLYCVTTMVSRIPAAAKDT
jgi:hypothetical protein